MSYAKCIVQSNHLQPYKTARQLLESLHEHTLTPCHKITRMYRQPDPTIHAHNQPIGTVICCFKFIRLTCLKRASDMETYLSAYTFRTRACKILRRDSRFHHRFLTRNLARRGTGKVPFQGRMAVTSLGAVSGWGMKDQNGVAFRKITPLHTSRSMQLPQQWLARLVWCTLQMG